MSLGVGMKNMKVISTHIPTEVRWKSVSTELNLIDNTAICWPRRSICCIRTSPLLRFHIFFVYKKTYSVQDKEF